MSKVVFQIGFYLEGQHFAQMEAFLPRVQALKIPQLKITQKKIQKQKQPIVSKQPKKAGRSKIQKSEKSESKKEQSDDQINNQQIDENNINVNQLQNEPDNQQDEQINLNENQEMIDQQRIDSSKQQQNLMKYLQDDQDSQDDDLDDDDLSSISRQSNIGMRSNHKTKRQKGQRSGLMELPDRRPRKDKKMDEATQLIRRQQKQRKRKQYLKKQIQANEKATLDKILNETGRKLKLKQQKQVQDVKKRDQKALKGLGDVPKIITVSNQQSNLILLHNMKLFDQQMTKVPQIKSRPYCSQCGKEQGRYKIKNTNKTACSLGCYKVLG